MKPTAPGAPTRVLIVDDSASMRAMLRKILDADPMIDVAGTAADAAHARALIKELEPDVLLLDVEMPGLDGMAVCAAIRQSHGDAFPVLLVTGRHDAEFVARAQTLAAGHLGKPVAWAALAGMLRSRLARPPG